MPFCYLSFPVPKLSCRYSLGFLFPSTFSRRPDIPVSHILVVRWTRVPPPDRSRRWSFVFLFRVGPTAVHGVLNVGLVNGNVWCPPYRSHVSLFSRMANAIKNEFFSCILDFGRMYRNGDLKYILPNMNLFFYDTLLYGFCNVIPENRRK